MGRYRRLLKHGRCEFLLPIWLTPVALLLVGAYAVWAAYELAFIRMRFAGRDGSLRAGTSGSPSLSDRNGRGVGTCRRERTASGDVSRSQLITFGLRGATLPVVPVREIPGYALAVACEWL